MVLLGFELGDRRSEDASNNAILLYMAQIESILYQAIGDHRVDGPNSTNVNVRLPQTMAAYMAALAAQNERTVAEEIRASLRVTIALSRLAIVMDADLQAERQSSSDGILGLKPAAAARHATAFRDQVIDELRDTLPGAHRVFERSFPAFLWGQPPAAA